MSVQDELSKHHDAEHFWAEQLACSGSKICDADPEHFCRLSNVGVQGQSWEDSDPEHFGPNNLHVQGRKYATPTLNTFAVWAM